MFSDVSSRLVCNNNSVKLPDCEIKSIAC
uniref:Uncharacterized protein n=1 Tax=Anguilla anguilla TaxID=7936 RepID=A0A0E9Q120_ANGAN